MNQYVRDLLIDIDIYDTESVQDTSKYSPDELIQKDGYNYILNDRGLTPDEIKIALLAKQIKFMKTIKNIILFYFWCTIVAGGIYIIYYLLYLLSNT